MSQSKRKGGGGQPKKGAPCMNPIFESWIREWKDEAEAKDSKLKYVYAKALKSLRLYPLPLASGKECKMLENFGDFMVKRIDTRMAEENMIPQNVSVTVQQDPQPGQSKKKKPTGTVTKKIPKSNRAISGTHASSSVQFGSGSSSGPIVSQSSSSTRSGCSSKGSYGGSEEVILLSSDEDEAQDGDKEQDGHESTHAPPPAKKSRTAGKAYLPAYRSGAYAILMAMYKTEFPVPDGRHMMTKSEILGVAQNFCDASMSKSAQGSHYTAWNSMSLLLKKGLVTKTGNPAKYATTQEGMKLSSTLYHAEYTKQPITSGSTGMDLPAINSNGTGVSNSTENSESGSALSTTPVIDIISDTETEIEAPIYEPIRLLPGKFDVILYVDTCETSGKSKPQEVVNELQKNGVTVHVTRLSVGDFVWVCREVSSATENRNRLTMGNQVELVLPYVVERKRSDDLAHSIRDGRYREQKYRLERTKLQTIYLVESYGSGDWGLANGALKQAVANTQIGNDFKIQETASIKDTCAYLTFMTRNLKSLYENRTLIGRHLTNYSGDARPNGPDEEYLLVFSDFNDSSAKKTNWNAMSLFARQLLRFKGVSTDKAYAIVNLFPTVHDLMRAYVRCENDKERESLLANIQFGSGNRRIGPSISRKIGNYYTMLTLPC